MTRPIHLLEDDVINKIAAGEVLERPASALKELVENALDAGATEVFIELEDGGKRRISVRDNGCGIAADELSLALTRHATSKVTLAEDLFRLETKGFRGEALASIAAVGRIQLTSRRAKDEVGAKLEGGADREARVVPWEGPVGSTVTVVDLFDNVPVRKKFLKASATELTHCLDWMQAIALSHLDISFEVRHNGKVHLRAEAVDCDRSHEERLRLRVSSVLGSDMAKDLLYGESEDRYGKWFGLWSAPGNEKGSGKFIWTFANGRWVKERTLRMAVMRGYHSHLLKGRYPVVIGFYQCDPSLIDANVHPAKTEVRFQYTTQIQDLIAGEIRRTMRQGDWARPRETDFSSPIPPQPTSARSPSIPRSSTEAVLRSEGALQSDPPKGGGLSRSDRAASLPTFNPAPLSKSGPSEPVDIEDMEALPTRQRTVLSRSGTSSLSGFSEFDPTFDFPKSGQQADSHEEAIPWHELRFIGSFAKCYLLFEYGHRLLVVDQHAFHERILYERLCHEPQPLGASEPLAIPETLSLDVEMVEKVTAAAESLRRIGFHLHTVSENEVEVEAVPSMLCHRDLEQLFAAVFASGSEVEAADFAHLPLATFACHTAVRAGEELDTPELQRLLLEAGDVDFYLNCPHGRRVFRWWDRSQVARWFDR